MSKELEHFCCSGLDKIARNLSDGESHIQHESIWRSDEIDVSIFISSPDNYKAVFVERVVAAWGEVGYSCEG